MLSGGAAATSLWALADDFFSVYHTADPLNATQLGVTGFDHLLPDPGRSAAARKAQEFSGIERRLAQIDQGTLDSRELTTASVLASLAKGARSDIEHCLWEANVSAQGYVSPQSMAFQAIPTAVLADAAAVNAYLQRLEGLPAFFDALGRRYREAAGDGRVPTAVGVRQAVQQLEWHVAADPRRHRLQPMELPPDVDSAAVRARVADAVEDVVKPALERLLAVLGDELLPVARGDEAVGITNIPGGSEGYLAAVERHTTTSLPPEEIHALGLAALHDLRAEWAELGGRVLGESDPGQILARLRNDPQLRFDSSEAIVRTVREALERAEAVRDEWFPPYDIPPCIVEEIDPNEDGNSALAYYRPPAAGGKRPGAHCVLTGEPELRFIYEYEALAFHESTPGHHLQIASAQTLEHLPAFRRYLDAEMCAYVEGWGLYSERLADEMGLYSSDLFRLGMLSFDALRACRLVVDTGMHHLGWSRQRAIDFMWANTATTRANVVNEIDRYIGWPGQALAYMVGRLHIQRLRAQAEEVLGSAFDIRQFHRAVLGEGAVPLGVLSEIVERFSAGEDPATANLSGKGDTTCE